MTVLCYIGASLAILWGASHLVPSRTVVAQYAQRDPDGHNVLLMEWISEGVFLIFLGVLVLLVSAINLTSTTSRAANAAAVAALVVLAVVSLFTGYRVRFLPFRLCPLIFTASGVLVAIGTFG